MTKPNLTQQQKDSLQKLSDGGWIPDLDTLHYLLGEGRNGVGCVMVICSTKNGSQITFGIEPDGYAHS